MKIHRRLRRALRFCLFGFLALLLVVSGSTWWAHRHLTRLTVEAINRTFPGLQLSAKTVAFTSTGELDLKAIRLRVRGDGSQALFIPSAQVRFSWRELHRQSVREIVIDQPRLRISDALVAALGSGSSSPAAAESGTPWRIGKLVINGGTARVELAGLPPLRCAFAVQMVEGATTGNSLRVSELHVRAPGEDTDLLAFSSLQISASPEDLRQGKLREVLLVAPELHLTDRLLALFPPTTTKPDSGRAWSCDRLVVQRGKLRVALAGWPQAELDLAIHAEQVAAEGGGAVALALTNVRVRLPADPADAMSIPALHLAGTVAGLKQGRVSELTLDDPRVTVTDRALAWRPPPTAAPATPSAPLPWKIDRLAIRRGHVRVDLAGAPLAEFGLGVGLQNAELAGAGAGDLQSLEILDLALRTRTAGVEPFLRVPAIRAEFRLPELLRQHRLARVRVEHLDFRYNAAFRAMIASGAKPAPAPPPPVSAEPAPVPTIGELRLTNGRLHLDDLGLGIPGIEARIETAFRELALQPGGGVGGHELQTIELSQIALRSPLDPFFTVLDLDTVFVRFTLADLWQRQIEEVAIVRPTLAIGPDLFWYIDRVQKNQDAAPVAAAPAPVDDGPPWVIRQFSAKSGQLVLALEGQAKLALPMPFESRAQNLNFRHLSDLRLKLQIDMPEQDYDYPGYQLTLRGMSGRIEFSLPPEKGRNNVVNTLRLRGVQWKEYRGRDVFLDVTYDERGVYGNLSGKGYTGLLRGQFNFLLTPESDWNGWVSGTHIDLRALTAVLAPEKFSLDSPADFRLTVAARAREILQVRGDFQARAPGNLRIAKLDDFIRELPGDWSGVKRGLSRISLEALRDFGYDTAHGDFSFTGLVGGVRLDLRGPGGSRKIEMNFHEAPPTAPAPRVATRQP